MSNPDKLKRIETVCFTGHRTIEHNISVVIPTVLKREIEALIARGARCFRAGGAMGFDSIAALCILELKEKYPDLRLELKLPCKDQARYWNDGNALVYKYILQKADSVEYISESYTSTCMYERNRRLVDGSDVCVAYLAQSRGGTSYTFGYALGRGIEVINIFDLINTKRSL
jgi:uncharacterized phage-like protein YoqJ